jgi:hypothetical protein
MDSYTFGEYIDFLRDNVLNLVQYREKTGTLRPELVRVKDNLFDADPFVVYNASLAATAALADQTIYH